MVLNYAFYYDMEYVCYAVCNNSMNNEQQVCEVCSGAGSSCSGGGCVYGVHLVKFQHQFHLGY